MTLMRHIFYFHDVDGSLFLEWQACCQMVKIGVFYLVAVGATGTCDVFFRCQRAANRLVRLNRLLPNLHPAWV